MMSDANLHEEERRCDAVQDRADEDTDEGDSPSPIIEPFSIVPPCVRRRP